jgi:hypothetical protein
MMTRIKKHLRWQAMSCIMTTALSVTALISCSDDWNDHYDATASGAGNGTLWQAIASRSDLSHFASVAKECGYDILLDGSQTYSVFVPTNDALTETEAKQLIAEFQKEQALGVRPNANSVIRQFLQNHMALYRHPVSSLTNETITMMNDKYVELTENTLGGNRILTANLLYDNGLLFTLAHQVDYIPNVFEYLHFDHELDSVYQFLNSHSVYEFDEARSVPGEIIDGVTHYLDSVSVLRNDILSQYGQIDSEDSTYWFVAPTNAEWNRLAKEYEPYFNYPNNVDHRDSLTYTNARLGIIGGAFFSRTSNPDEAFRDSAVSTQAVSSQVRTLLEQDDTYYIYYKPFDEGGVFHGTEDIECSNGHVRKASQFNIPKLKTFVQTIKVEAENTQYQDSIIKAVEPLTVLEVPSGNPYYGKVSGNTFVEVIPETPDASVQVIFELPNMLSALNYDIYGVFVPATAYDTLAVAETQKSYRVRSVLRYPDQNGHEATRRIAGNKNVNTTVVDTVKLVSAGSIPTCTYGLSNAKVKIEIQSGTNGATLRLDCIIVKPSELEEAEN